MNFLKFFRSKLEKDFNATLSVKIGVGDRVRHRQTDQLGRCIQTGLINGTVRVPAVSVLYDDGKETWLVPAEEFTKVRKTPRVPLL